jgi:hypothetical protein
MSLWAFLQKWPKFQSSEFRGVLPLLKQDRRNLGHYPAKELVLPSGRKPLQPPHRRYLESRGFDPDKIVRLWNVEGFGPHPKYPWRIFIPIYHNGVIASWTTRSISDEKDQRYGNAGIAEELESSKDLLYGEEYARNAVCVSEGYLDAWAVGPGGVATGGINVSKTQLLRIASYPVRVIIPDNEPLAIQRADKLCDQLEPFAGSTFKVVLSSGKDASRASKTEIKELRRQFLE